MALSRQSVGPAEVGATAGRSTGLVEPHIPGRGPDDPQELTLRTDRPTGDAGSIRDAPRGAGPRQPVYDATSPDGTAAAAFFVARLGLAPASGADPSVGLTSGSSGALFAAAGFAARLGLAAGSVAVVGWSSTAVASTTAGSDASAVVAAFFATFATRFGLAVSATAGASAAAGCSVSVAVGPLATASAAALASATETSLRISIRQPVSRAASRAFWPSRPIASDSIRSGTVTLAMRCSSSMSTEMTCAGLRALATNRLASSLHGMTSIFSPDSSATTAWTRAPRWPTVAPTGSRPSWRDADGDLRAAAGLAGDGLDLDRAAVDLGDLELEQALEEALVRAADEDLRTLGGAPDLEHERLDVLADPVVLERALLGRGQDRLDVLADVEDDRPRLDPVDGAGDQLALATGELVEDLVALDLADALEDDLLGGLGADPAEDVAVELLGLDEVADLGAGLECLGLLDGHLGELVLDLVDDATRAEDADLAGLGVDPDVDVLVTSDTPIGGLDAVLDGSDELLSRDLLLGVELEEGTDEVSTHDGLRSLCRCLAALKKKRGGHPRRGAAVQLASTIHPGAWTPQMAGVGNRSAT